MHTDHVHRYLESDDPRASIPQKGCLMSIDTQNLATVSQTSRGMSVIYEAIAEALLNIPDTTVVDDVKRVAAAMGDERFADVTPSSDLEQRFYNRFFVSSSVYHIAWTESAIWNSGIVDGRIEYASPVPSRKAHVAACYEDAGFDYRRLSGYEIAVSTLSPDAFASEMAFMAYLHDGGARAAEAEDPATAQANLHLAKQFLEQHPSRWASRLAEMAALTGDDYYTRVLSFATEIIALDLEQLNVIEAR